MFYLPQFTINKTVYIGLDFIKKSDIDSYVRGNFLTRRWWWPRDNYFLLNAKKIEKGLLKNYSLNAATVKKIFPRELRIDVEEKITTIIYDNGFQYFLLDNEGRAIKYLAEAINPEQNTAPDLAMEEPLLIMPSFLSPTTSADSSVSSTPSVTTTSRAARDNIITGKTHRPEYRKLRKDFGDYLIVYDARNRPVAEGQTDILSREFIRAVIDWSDLLDKEGIGDDVRYMLMDHPMAGVVVYTEQPWLIYFQPASDLSAQMMNLKAISQRNKLIEYIDLRFGDRVFWK